MVRHPRYLLFCALATVTAVVLAAASLGMDTKAVPREGAFGIQTVRGYYSALNEYMHSGQQEVMSSYLQYLPDPETTSMPQTTDRLGAVIKLAALRQSYPDIHFSVVAIDSAGDSVVAAIETEPGTVLLPAWINGDDEAGASPDAVYFRIEDRTIVGHTADSMAMTSFLNVVKPATLFRMEMPGRIAIAELNFSAASPSKKHVPLPGPGVFTVKSGSVEVIGNGLAEIAYLETSDRTLVPVGAEWIANQGDTIIVPMGKVVVRPNMEIGTTILAATMVPVEADSHRYFEREKVDQTRMALGLLDLLRELPVGVQPIWFGTAEVLNGESAVTGAGWLSLEAGWLVVSPGERVDLESQGRQMAVHAGAPGVVIDMSRSWSTISITNTGVESALVFVARASEADELP